MNKQIAPVIGWLLLLITFGIYLYGIHFAICHPLKAENNTVFIPEPLDSIITTINAILLTNLGAVLGIAVTKPSSGLARMTLIGSKTITVPDPVTKREMIQYSALVIYLLVLLACFASWAHNTFADPAKIKPVADLVVQNGKTLFGVIAAYLAFVLGRTGN